MAMCIAALIGFVVPWIAFWALVVLIAAHIVLGPVGWIALAVSLGVSLGFLIWAIGQCTGRTA